MIYYVAQNTASVYTGQALFQQQNTAAAGRITKFTPAPDHDVVVLHNVAHFSVSAPLGTPLNPKDLADCARSRIIVLSASSGRYVTEPGAQRRHVGEHLPQPRA